MTKDDKAKIAKAWQEYSIAATQCSNVLYNLSQSDQSPATTKYGKLVREHDAARNHLDTILKQFSIVRKP